MMGFIPETRGKVIDDQQLSDKPASVDSFFCDM